MVDIVKDKTHFIRPYAFHKEETIVNNRIGAIQKISKIKQV